MKNVLCVISLLFVVVLSAQAAVHHEEVQYTANGVTLKGYLAYDDAIKGKRPGVLVVHEWWGNNEYSRHRADMLAGLGYVALALDMYGDGKQGINPDEAGKLATATMSNLPEAKARFVAALEVLKKNPHTDPARVAAIGYCFGGGVVLHMARMGVDLKGVVSFHGSYEAYTPAKDVKAAVLVCNGDADQFTPPDAVAALRKEMQDAKVNLEFISYPDAKHAFTNPAADDYAKKYNIPVGYNAAADKKSWLDMEKFFKKIFAK